MHAPLSPTLRVEWRAISELDSIAEQWRSLAARALEPNVFYDPAFALAAAPVFGEGCGALLVWSNARQADGPVSGARAPAGATARCRRMTGWTHPYAPLGTPLVDRDEAGAGDRRLARSSGARSATPALLMLPMLPESGAFARALDAVLARNGMPQRIVRAAPPRAAQAAADSQDDQAVSPRRRKELLRQRRRLEEFAPVTFTTAATPRPIAAALEDFLVLEASGWKGLAQTAAANDPAVRRFVETAVTALRRAGPGADRPHAARRANAIAVAITLSRGDTGWFWKIAYNEGVARFSPGVQLVYELTPDRWQRIAGAGAGRFLRHRRSPDDRPHVARPPGALRPADRGEARRRCRSSWSAEARRCAAPRSPRPNRCATGCEAAPRKPRQARARSSRRITFPVVVIGISAMKATSRGYSWADSRVRTKPWMSAASASDAATPDFNTTNALTISVRIGSGLPTTAASATAGCLIRQSSISPGPMR